MVNFQSMERYSFQDLNRIMALLRQPGGCPWDREQTHESIRRNMLEEAYEAVEAIDEKDPGHLKEELGDVLSRVSAAVRCPFSSRFWASQVFSAWPESRASTVPKT